MGKQESRRDKKIFQVTHDPGAAERPWSEVLKEGEVEVSPGEGSRSASEDLAEPERQEPITPETPR